ncbi:hypothetical protein [Fusobacterium sp. SYSU M8D902]|uniref:hypothetical protein n=1 Tax=Fusobacterium sp. SYSU M8D902 TaxID=3159562 RepID=UPI0032E49A1C
MKELLEFLSEVKNKKYDELIASIELQKDTLEEISKELGNVYVPQLLTSQNYEKINEAVEKIKFINNKAKELEELLIKNLEVNEEITEDNEEILVKDYDKYRVDENEKHTLYEIFRHKRPCAFVIENKRIEANNWKEVLIDTCNYLSEKNKKILEEIVINEKIKGRKRSLFSVTKKQMFSPEKLKYINGYVETNLSADGIKNLIKKLLKIYEVPLNKYYIHFRADYSEMKE